MASLSCRPFVRSSSRALSCLGHAAAWPLALALSFGALPAAAVPVTYTVTALNATARAGVEIGLGSVVISNTFSVVSLTFEGDTDDVRTYSIHGTSGYIIDRGTATLYLRDVYNDLTYNATFDPGLIYVGNDVTNGGIGFGSVIYPIYPFALFSSLDVPTSDPALDLRHDFLMNSPGWGQSCVGIVAGCRNRDAAVARTYTLHTDLGDFWMTGQGITAGVFQVQTHPPELPEPSSLLLAGAALGLMVRRRPGRA